MQKKSKETSEKENEELFDRSRTTEQNVVWEYLLTLMVFVAVGDLLRLTI